MAAYFAWPWSVYEDRLVYAGRVEQSPAGTVTSFAAVSGFDGSPGFHIVRLDDGELLALLDRPPHLGYPVPYRPDFVFGGRTGWFRSPLHGEIFDMSGQRVYGPSPRGLDRLTGEVREGILYVDPQAITRGARRYPDEGYELQTGGALLPPHRPLGR